MVDAGSAVAHKLYLIRHGQSEWNAKDLFTGWVDVPLSPQGEQEALAAAELFLHHQIHFDFLYTSVLQRSIKTAWIILEKMKAMAISQKAMWQLNERHYGGLQGKNKTQTRQQFGEEQVKIWRRSYRTRPPELKDSQPLPNYANGLASVPLCESLEDTVVRVEQVWEEEIAPQVKQGKTLLISAHGNSLRGLLKHLEGISDDDIVGLEIPTGKPIEVLLDSSLRVIERRYLVS